MHFNKLLASHDYTRSIFIFISVAYRRNQSGLSHSHRFFHTDVYDSNLLQKSTVYKVKFYCCEILVLE